MRQTTVSKRSIRRGHLIVSAQNGALRTAAKLTHNLDKLSTPGTESCRRQSRAQDVQQQVLDHHDDLVRQVLVGQSRGKGRKTPGVTFNRFIVLLHCIPPEFWLDSAETSWGMCESMYAPY